ncbi:MAG: ATP-binding protein [Alphaproteobacteria bacterium]
MDRTGRWLLATLFALGIGSILMLLTNHAIYGALIADRLNVMRTVAEVRTQAALVHVWIEELVSGDQVERAPIEDALETSARLLSSLEAAENADSWSNRLLVEDGAVQSGLDLAAAHFCDFAELSRSRQTAFDRGGDVGIGSEADVVYDQLFESLLIVLEDLHMATELRLANAMLLERRLARLVVLLWSVIVVMGFMVIWSYRRKRHRAELALRDSEHQLFQAQKREAVSRLAGGIAHDINNHLAAISMQCEAIKLKGVIPADVRQRVDAIIGTANKSAAMIRRLLAFGRQQPVKPELIDVNRVIRDLETNVLAGLLDDSVRLQTRLAPRLSRISIDPSQLEQILLNLITNACEAMPSGGDLTIATGERCMQQGTDADEIMIAVTDSGEGIPKDVQDRIFEPFFTTKDLTANSGLGLSTIDGIVRQSSGRVEVESAAGKGTTFRILLPAAGVEAGDDRRPVLEAPQARGGTILLVEDNDELRRSTALALRSFGHRIHTAATPEQAQAIFADHASAIELAIVDVIMPDMSGQQLVERLKCTQRELKVLFVSGYAGDRLSSGMIAAPEVGFLAKPYSLAELARRVAAMLDDERVPCCLDAPPG